MQGLGVHKAAPSQLILTHPDSSTVSGAHFVQPVLAQQIEEGAVRLQEAALVVVDGHLFEDPLVHQGRAFDPVPEPVLDLDLPHQDGLDAPLQCIQDGWNLAKMCTDEERAQRSQTLFRQDCVICGRGLVKNFFSFCLNAFFTELPWQVQHTHTHTQLDALFSHTHTHCCTTKAHRHITAHKPSLPVS